MNRKLIAITRSIPLVSALLSNQKFRPITDTERKQRSTSLKAFQGRERRNQPLTATHKHRQEIDETSVSISCGIIGDFPELQMQIKASVHYFFSGHHIPRKLQGITITLNVEGVKPLGHTCRRHSEIAIRTNRRNKIFPITDGMRSLEKDQTNSVFLAIMTESETRHILKHGINSIEMGPVYITHPECIEEAIRIVIQDIDKRRLESVSTGERR